MPLPLIPVLLGGAAVAAAGFGIKKGVDAKSDLDSAKSINAKAKGIADKAEKALATEKESTTKAIEALGAGKIDILSTAVMDFVDNFGRIKNVELEDSVGLDELKNFNPQSEEFLQLKTLAFDAKSVAVNGISSIAAGGLLAYGTYNVVLGGLGGLLVTATTGTALSSLTGVAATNATLAWLGGGALAAGGLGMVGGMAVLGGIVAGPALAVGGALFAKQADKAYWDAKSNVEKAKAFEEQTKGIVSVLQAIHTRADQLTDLLARLKKPFDQMVFDMKAIISVCGTDWNDYTEEQKRKIYRCVQTAQAVKAVLDSALLSESGKLLEESAVALENGENYLATLD